MPPLSLRHVLQVPFTNAYSFLGFFYLLVMRDFEALKFSLHLWAHIRFSPKCFGDFGRGAFSTSYCLCCYALGRDRFQIRYLKRSRMYGQKNLRSQLVKACGQNAVTTYIFSGQSSQTKRSRGQRWVILPSKTVKNRFLGNSGMSIIVI
jgi:hypothetical protein